MDIIDFTTGTITHGAGTFFEFEEWVSSDALDGIADLQAMQEFEERAEEYSRLEEMNYNNFKGLE